MLDSEEMLAIIHERIPDHEERFINPPEEGCFATPRGPATHMVVTQDEEPSYGSFTSMDEVNAWVARCIAEGSMNLYRRGPIVIDLETGESAEITSVKTMEFNYAALRFN